MPNSQTEASTCILLLHLILEITDPFGLIPLCMNGITSPNTESLVWTSMSVASGT